MTASADSRRFYDLAYQALAAPHKPAKMKRMWVWHMKSQSVLLGTIFLAGCMIQQPPNTNETRNQRNYSRDLYECEREATFAGANKQQVFDSCMKARGYAEKRSSQLEVQGYSLCET